jgi:hypothetical protein
VKSTDAILLFRGTQLYGSAQFSQKMRKKWLNSPKVRAEIIEAAAELGLTVVEDIPSVLDNVQDALAWIDMGSQSFTEDDEVDRRILERKLMKRKKRKKA